MAQDAVINGTTYPAVEAVALTDGNGNVTQYYPDAVRYVAQTLTEAQKAQVRENIGAISEVDVPVKGVDYWTEADQEEIVQQVIAALGTPVFGRVDENKHITLSGHLTDGTYTLRFEDSDGYTTDVYTINKSSAPAYTNLLPTSIDNTGAAYNGTGLKNGYRLTGGAYPCESADAEYFCTGYIPYTKAQASARVPMYVKGITIDLSNVPKYTRVLMVDAYNTTDGYIDTLTITGDSGASNQITIQQLGDQYYKLTPNSGFISSNFDDWKNKELQFIRWSFPGTGDGVIFTVDEPIE